MLEINGMLTVLIFILRTSLTLTAILGFGLYLWYLKSSDEHYQSRLLNFLNGYLALICIGFTSFLFVIFIVQPQEDLIARIGSFFIIAVSAIFVFISGATILKHFMPGLYLDISVTWSHKIAIPISAFVFILVEQLLHYSCPEMSLECMVFRTRTLVMIPATLTSFICQLLVIIDDIWGWRRIYTYLRGLCRPNLVTPINNGDIEMAENNQQQPFDPTQHPVGVLFVIHYQHNLHSYSVSENFSDHAQRRGICTTFVRHP